MKVNFNPDSANGGVDDLGNTIRPPFVGLAHELGHAETIVQGTHQASDPNAPGHGQKGTTPPSEVNSLKRENEVRQEHNLTERSNYNQ